LSTTPGYKREILAISKFPKGRNDSRLINSCQVGIIINSAPIF
jgi:hypothetical protein